MKSNYLSIITTVLLAIAIYSCKKDAIGPDIEKYYQTPDTLLYRDTAAVLISDFTKTAIYAYGTNPGTDPTFKYWPSEYPLPSTSNTAFNPTPDGKKYLYFNATVPANASTNKIAYTFIDANTRMNASKLDTIFPLNFVPNQLQ